MRKLIVQEFVTIDGFAAAAGGPVERDQLRLIKDEVATMRLGRTTYEIFIDYWPTATQDEIFAERDRNVEEARRRQLRRQEAFKSRERQLPIVES